MMRCDVCGKDFQADARACLESGIDVVAQTEDGEEWKEDFTPIDPRQFPLAERQAIMEMMELDDAQFDELLLTGKIEGLGAIVCLGCQDKLE